MRSAPDPQHDRTAAAWRRRATVLSAAFAAASLMISFTYAAGPAPVTPQVQEKDVNSMAEENPVVPWKPGDPVRIVPDLRESADGGDGQASEASVEMLPPRAIQSPSPQERPQQVEQPQPQSVLLPPRPMQPAVQAPVAPQVIEEGVGGLPKIKPYREGDPVRIVPDLRESGTNQ